MNEIVINRWKEFTKAYIDGARPNITTARAARLWREAEYFINMFVDEPGDESWDRYVGDAFVEVFNDYRNHITVNASDWTGGYIKDNPRYFANHLEAALRAGINAAADSGDYGVLGFTVGDLKRAFGGNIPDWVTCRYKNHLTDAKDGVLIFL